MKQITQETFDGVVLEGVQDFDNTIEEAIENAKKEFEAQGVALFSIVMNMRLSANKEHIIHDILEALKHITAAADRKAPFAELSEPLAIFTQQCKLSVAHRILATNHGAYTVLLKTIELAQQQRDSHLLEAALQAVVALTESNPDIMTDTGFELLLQLMDDQEHGHGDGDVPEQLAKWSYESCLKHELNRQKMVAAGAQGRLMGLMKGNRRNDRVVRAACRALRAFALDDDIRAEFGKSHDHARMLVEEHSGIKICLDILKDWLSDAEVASELLSTLSRLCVRAEYCQEAVDCGALVTINDILVSFPNNAGLNKQAISLLTAISGNDKVKEAVMKTGAPELIVTALVNHQVSAGVCESCCSAISMLALRVPAHAYQLSELGAGQAVMQAMKIHPEKKQVQKLGCMATRNLVSRVPENRAMLLDCGAEEVINMAMKTHGPAVKDVAKAALRDLDVKVELVEQWHGKGHQIGQ